jgi:hypothetical protein
MRRERKREQRATDLLNVAIAGAEAALTIAFEESEFERRTKLIVQARRHLEEAREHLLKIQSHANQI